MRFWLGILVSMVFHALLFCIPVAVSLPREATHEKLQLIIEQGATHGEAKILENPVNQGCREHPADLPTRPGGRETEDSKLSAEAQEDEKAHELAGTAMNPPDEPRVPDPSSSSVAIPKAPALKRDKKPQKPSVIPHRNETPLREASPAGQLAHAEIPPAQERREIPAVGIASGNQPSPYSDANAGGRGPIDASFGSQDGPRFITKVLPRYPTMARMLGKEGTVLLRLTIDDRGRLVDVQIVKRAGSGFDEEALRAVNDSTFSPARRNGRPVVCKAHLPIQFVLKDVHDD